MSAPRIDGSLSSGSTVGFANWSPSDLVPGPQWSSFEKLRLAGGPGLDSIKAGTVATLWNKSRQFRILRDEDFQRLVGIASEVHRLKSGITIVLQAARVVARHKDEESVNLLINYASMLGASMLLPEREGHGQFRLEPEDLASSSDPGEVDMDNIPRPSLD
jgi:hypothetical protein